MAFELNFPRLSLVFNLKHLHPNTLRYEILGFLLFHSSSKVLFKIGHLKIQFEIYQEVLMAST